MRINIDHTTVYRYAEAPRRVIQLLRLTPSSFVGQSVLEWRIDVDCDAHLREGRDGYGNVTHMLYVDKPTRELAISLTGLVLTENHAGIVRGIANDLPPQVFLRPTRLTQPGPNLCSFATDLNNSKAPTLDRLHQLNSHLHSRLRFDTSATNTETTAEEAFSAGHGVCQDFAHIFIALARQMHIPARYVSGHFCRRDGSGLQEAAHAWTEAYVEDLGWVSFDPTHGLSNDENYVRVACGLDYRDASPISGARLGGGEERLAVEVKVSGHSESQVQN
jgi:transglutaminase-like putative cysteine protease